jgi:hypothetical protein
VNIADLSNHSPGPWCVNRWVIYDATGRAIGQLYGGAPNTPEEAVANAKLVSIAPMLLQETMNKPKPD